MALPAKLFQICDPCSRRITVGSRFGCLHPVTSYRLYSTLSLPIVLYGCELWTLSKTESLMLEHVHRKILRTIQGLPIRCPSIALTSLLGSRDISSFISQQQLTFINSITSMSSTDLPRLILQQRLLPHRSPGSSPDGNNFWTISTFHPLKSCYAPQRAKPLGKIPVKHQPLHCPH